MKFLRYFLVISFFTLTACSTITSNNEASSNKAKKKEYVIVLHQDIQMKTKGEFGNSNINPGELFLQKGIYKKASKNAPLAPTTYENKDTPAKFHHKKTFGKKRILATYPQLKINKKNELIVYLITSSNLRFYAGKIKDASKFELVEVAKKDAL